VADQGLANELAEIGVILLMFGVGLHFSLKDLMSVRTIAVPGAIAQIAAATLLGMALGWALGWSTPAGLVFGLALSVASTVVLLRALQERRLIAKPGDHGRARNRPGHDRRRHRRPACAYAWRGPESWRLNARHDRCRGVNPCKERSGESL
jgi:hypothetical protein